MRAVQTVGAKGDMFGLADGGSVVAGVSKGAPVKAVMAVTNSSPYSLAVRADAGIKTLKDIEGKTVASAPGEAGLQLLPALVRAQRRRHRQGARSCASRAPARWWRSLRSAPRA